MGRESIYILIRVTTDSFLPFFWLYSLLFLYFLVLLSGTVLVTVTNDHRESLEASPGLLASSVRAIIRYEYLLEESKLST